MLILGFSGGPDLVDECGSGLTPIGLHDAACVLLEDQHVLFAIEEERLNRIKHTNKFPAQAMRACLNNAQVRLADVDAVAFYASREGVNYFGKSLFLGKLDEPVLLDGAALIQHRLCRALGETVDASKLCFVHHHHAHAASAFALSGFDRSLIITIDAVGESSSGMVFIGDGTNLTQIADLPVRKSLGFFYIDVIRYLGFKPFDEYKVMGLAPYGNSDTYRPLFRQFYTLLPDGDFELHTGRLLSLFEVLTPRRKAEPLRQVHKDIAASLQETLEEIVFHAARPLQEATGERRLCLAGGVAQNCTMNGKLLRSGIFEEIFVQPAAHDAGAALGAAIYAYYRTKATRGRPCRMTHLYWGTEIGDASSILRELEAWTHFVSVRRSPEICGETAELLAAGRVIGWVQGRSEFGPRALGNRSILADPRPHGNKDRINRMVKKREAYRPFAPSVLEEYASEFFETMSSDKGPEQSFPFMIFVVKVKEEKQELLGAVTHIDGTARVQTVAKATNDRFWKLIEAFRVITGVPVLLNTSFNNNVEPIVDSVTDAVTCYLTTQLDYLIVGDYVVERRAAPLIDYLQLKPSLPPYMTLEQVKRPGLNGPHSGATNGFALRTTFDQEFQHPLSAELYDLLWRADGERTVECLMADLRQSNPDASTPDALATAFFDLWSRRLVVMKP